MVPISFSPELVCFRNIPVSETEWMKGGGLGLRGGVWVRGGGGGGLGVGRLGWGGGLGWVIWPRIAVVIRPCWEPPFYVSRPLHGFYQNFPFPLSISPLATFFLQFKSNKLLFLYLFCANFVRGIKSSLNGTRMIYITPLPPLPLPLYLLDLISLWKATVGYHIVQTKQNEIHSLAIFVEFC